MNTLTVISNTKIKDISVLKECATLLYVILAKECIPQAFSTTSRSGKIDMDNGTDDTDDANEIRAPFAVMYV